MDATRYIFAASLGVLLAVAGCGFEAGPSAFDDQRVDNEDNNDNGGSTVDELGAGQGAGTVDGTWLKVHIASSCVFDQEQVSATYLIVDIDADGTTLTEHRTLCELDASPVLGNRPVASSDTLATVEYPVIDQGMVSSHTTGGGYSSSTAVGLWGINLDDPLTDPVPTDADDDRVVDADGDGNPGVTMYLDGAGCDRYMGQRQVVRFSGALEAPNDIRGASVRTTDTVVYGGTATSCEMAPDVISNDAHSFFRMVRVDGLGGAVDASADGGEIRCEDVEPFFDDIWDVREPDDDHCQ